MKDDHQSEAPPADAAGTDESPAATAAPPVETGERSDAAREGSPIKIVMVDDEDRFRTSLAERLRLRGYRIWDVADGEEAIRLCRQKRPDVAIVDLKMPRLSGETVLKEIKRICPEVQVIILTGHASLESAAGMGRAEAFAYLEKPCETEVLVETLEAAALARVHALAKMELPEIEMRSLWSRLWGTYGMRPFILALGAVLFGVFALMPTPASLQRLVGAEKTGKPERDSMAGYPEYPSMKVGQTIAERYSANSKRYVKERVDGKLRKTAVPPVEAGRAARVSIGVLLVAALFWATGALPIGFTALLVASLLVLFNVFPPNMVAKAFAKDSVIFVFGVLALAQGITRTGLDRRIGLVLLGTSRSIPAFLFLFLPLLGVTASFLSEHALVAFLAPILMVVYLAGIRAAGLKQDKALIVMFLLGLCFAANQGGPGSPAAGGRNAVMIGILSDYGMAPSFGEWVKYGLPFVPVMALVIAGYFFFALRRQLKVKNLNVAAIVRKEAEKLGPMTRDEYITAMILGLVIVLWIGASKWLGMGGPALIGLVLMAGFRLISWRTVNRIPWDVVALYAAASGIGVALANTGAAIWIAGLFVDALPMALRTGEGLAVASSLITGTLTNFMSDGATVAAVGPVTVPMAQIAGTSPLMVGLATAFASSFANIFIIGTPNNAMVYALARDPETGEQLITMKDFARHGLMVTLLAFVVLIGWTIFGYWRWIGF